MSEAVYSPFEALQTDLNNISGIPDSVRAHIADALEAQQRFRALQCGVVPLNEWAAIIHANAIEKGWWEEERGLPEILMLCVSELAEALEEYRDGKPLLYCERFEQSPCGECTPETFLTCHGANSKPEGVAVELADCVIRILDYCGRAGIDIEGVISLKHEYNTKRPHRHGGKKC